MQIILSITTLLCAFLSVASAFPSAYMSLTLSSIEPRQNQNGTQRGGNSINRTCKKLSTLEKITRIAANQTRLDDLVAQGKLSADRVEALKAKAANATIELATMTSNATLVSECAVVNAHKRVRLQCKTMAKLAKLAKIANNQTAIDALATSKSLNSTQVQRLQNKIANATAKLQAMQSNTTLTDLCTKEKKSEDDDSQENNQAPAAVSTSAASSMASQTIPFIVGVAAVFAILL